MANLTTTFYSVLEHTTGIRPKGAKSKVTRLEEALANSVKYVLPSTNILMEARDAPLASERATSRMERTGVALDIGALEACAPKARITKASTMDGLTWSDEAPSLVHRVETATPQERDALVRDRRALLAFFTTLRLSGLGIRSLDAGTRDFENVVELTVSDNDIADVEVRRCAAGGVRRGRCCEGGAAVGCGGADEPNG